MERASLIKQWREEAKAEEDARRREQEYNRWYRKLGRYFESKFEGLSGRIIKKLAWTEAFIANIPLTIGGIALATANLGVDWFKFAEENMESCEPVRLVSSILVNMLLFSDHFICFNRSTSTPHNAHSLR